MEIKAKELKPLNGNVLVVDDPKVTETKSGLIIPESVTGDTQRMVMGTVITTSEVMIQDGTFIEIRIKEGDKVLYPFVSGAGNVFIGEDKRIYRILRYFEILAYED